MSFVTGRELRQLFQSRVFQLFLKKSWKGVLSMAAHVFFMVYLLEPTVRFFFPPEKISMLGLIEIAPKGGETWERIVRIADPILWIGGLSLFFAYLESRVRPTISEAREEREAGIE